MTEGIAMLQAYGLMGWRCGYIAVRSSLDTSLKRLAVCTNYLCSYAHTVAVSQSLAPSTLAAAFPAWYREFPPG